MSKTDAKEIRNLLNVIEGKQLTDEELQEGILSNLWDRVKAFFGSNEAAGRVAIMTTAQRMIAAFRKYIGPRRDNINNDAVFNQYLFKWLVDELSFDEQIIAKAANTLHINIGRPKQQSKPDEQKPEQQGQPKGKEDKFDINIESVNLSLRRYLKEETIVEASIGMKNSELQKFFMTLITVAQDSGKLPGFVTDTLKQEFDKEEKKQGGENPSEKPSTGSGSASTSPSKSSNEEDMLSIDKKKFTAQLKATNRKWDDAKKAAVHKFDDLIKSEVKNGKEQKNPLLDDVAAVGYAFLKVLGK